MNLASSTTLLYEMCSPRGRNIVRKIHKQETKLPLIMPDNTIYECGICAGVISWFRLEVFSVWFLQHILVVKYFGCKKCGIGIRDYRNRLIFKIGFVTWLTRRVPLGQWGKRERDDIYTLFDWVKSVRSLIQREREKYSMGQWTSDL
jgi:hypothetical protein